VLFFVVTDLRPCEGQPCLNNGTCVVYLRSYLCQCQKGFTGRSCESGKYFRENISMVLIMFSYERYRGNM
jgi:hypothetical protein